MSEKVKVGIFMHPLAIQHLDALADAMLLGRSDVLTQLVEMEYKKLEIRREAEKFPTVGAMWAKEYPAKGG